MEDSWEARDQGGNDLARPTHIEGTEAGNTAPHRTGTKRKIIQALRDIKDEDVEQIETNVDFFAVRALTLFRNNRTADIEQLLAKKVTPLRAAYRLYFFESVLRMCIEMKEPDTFINVLPYCTHEPFARELVIKAMESFGDTIQEALTTSLIGIIQSTTRAKRR